MDNAARFEMIYIKYINLYIHINDCKFKLNSLDNPTENHNNYNKRKLFIGKHDLKAKTDEMQIV